LVNFDKFIVCWSKMCKGRNWIEQRRSTAKASDFHPTLWAAKNFNLAPLYQGFGASGVAGLALLS
jgi:hypothetical protein